MPWSSPRPFLIPFALALGAGLAVVAPPGDARAQEVPLWCDGLEPYVAGGGTCANNGCVDGEIPIGPDAAQGHHWKEVILDWLRTLDPMEFDLGGVPDVTPIEDEWFNLSPWWNANNANACEADTQWPAVLSATNLPGSDAYLESESLLLHRSGEEWGALVNLRTPNSQFDMTNLEDRGQCFTRVPEYELDPELTSFADMQYAGNPYYTDPALRRAMLLRGVANAGLYLVLLDYRWWPHSSLGTAYVNGGGFPAAPPGSVANSDISPYTGNVLPRVGLKYDDFHGSTVIATNSQMNDFDISGWAISNFAYVYMIARDGLGADLPTDVQDAFEEALLTFAERIATQRQLTLFSNLASRSVVALWFAMEAQSDANDRAYLRSVYDDASETFYDPILTNVQPWGTLHDVSGFDTGYNNLNLLHMTKLLIGDPTGGGPNLRAAADRAFDLWAHLVFPEHLADGSMRYLSPTAFNSRTGKGAEGGDGWFGDATVVQRFLPAGVLGLPWAWAVLKHAGYPWGTNTAVDPWVQMVCDWIYEKFDYYFNLSFNNIGGAGVPPSMLTATPPIFDYTHSGFNPLWPGRSSTLIETRGHTHPNAAFLYGQVFDEKGAWFTAWNTAAPTVAANEMPYEVTPPYYWSAASSFTSSAGGAFFYARPSAQFGDDLVSLVHAGPVGPLYDNPDLPDGYGGGQLATLWTPTGGTFELARRRGRNADAQSNDSWSEWRSLPVHAVTITKGTSATPSITSTTRIITPTVESQSFAPTAPSDATALAWLSGHTGCAQAQLPWSLTSSQGPSGNAQLVSIRGSIPTTIHGSNVVSAPVPYRREILTGVGYVAVQTSLCPTNSNKVDAAIETIPLHYGDVTSYYHQLPTSSGHGDYTVTFVTNTNGTISSFVWDPSMTASLFPTMFANTQKVIVQRFGGTLEIEFDVLRRVGLSAAYDAHQGRSWNLMIDLLPSSPAILPTTSVRYVMRVN